MVYVSMASLRPRYSSLLPSSEHQSLPLLWEVGYIRYMSGNICFDSRGLEEQRSENANDLTVMVCDFLRLPYLLALLVPIPMSLDDRWMEFTLVVNMNGFAGSQFWKWSLSINAQHNYARWCECCGDPVPHQYDMDTCWECSICFHSHDDRGHDPLLICKDCRSPLPNFICSRCSTAVPSCVSDVRSSQFFQYRSAIVAFAWEFTEEDANEEE